MTRLIAEQIRSIPTRLESYDAELIAKTGCSLKQLSAAAAAVDLSQCQPENYKVAVIPVTSGQGTIEGFSEAVCAIAGHFGFRASVTGSSDAGGLAEAFESGADILILADDNVYVAINPASRRVAGNAEATARGYTVALSRMAGGLRGREVLLIGAGQVGQKAAEALLKAGAGLIVFDLDKNKEAALAAAMSEKFQVTIESGLTLDQALARFPLIFDASPGQGLIGAEQVSGETLAAAPGLPLGFTPAALEIIGPRLIHDPLQIGTAVMLFQALT
jgi:3-methylornithyl-N6-L-lysine dehydrogenase